MEASPVTVGPGLEVVSSLVASVAQVQVVTAWQAAWEEVKTEIWARAVVMDTVMALEGH